MQQQKEESFLTTQNHFKLQLATFYGLALKVNEKKKKRKYLMDTCNNKGVLQRHK